MVRKGDTGQAQENLPHSRLAQEACRSRGATRAPSGRRRKGRGSARVKSPSPGFREGRQQGRVLGRLLRPRAWALRCPSARRALQGAPLAQFAADRKKRRPHRVGESQRASPPRSQGRGHSAAHDLPGLVVVRQLLQDQLLVVTSGSHAGRRPYALHPHCLPGRGPLSWPPPRWPWREASALAGCGRVAASQGACSAHRSSGWVQGLQPMRGRDILSP